METIPAALLCRGFVEGIALPLAGFQQHAQALFAQHPIASVELTDREPVTSNAAGLAGLDVGWWASRDEPPEIHQPEDLPDDIWHKLEGAMLTGRWKWYPSIEAAHAALSRACVTYGRSLAGLPLLALTLPA